MLPTAHRLRTRGDFASVYAQGKAYHGKYLRIHVLQTQIPFRCGIVIPNAVIRSAVLRNRTKRQLRAILRQLLSSPTLPSVDCAIVLKKQSSTSQISFADLLDDVTVIFRKAHIL